MENDKKHVTKRNRLSTKKWTKSEEGKILDYLQNTILGNNDFEKPTAAVYYEKMKNDLELPANVIQLKNKIKNLKRTYEKALQWENQTGQGVESGTVRETILNMCPNFDALEELFGSKTNIQPPYTYDTSIDNNEFFNEYIEEETIDLEDTTPEIGVNNTSPLQSPENSNLEQERTGPLERFKKYLSTSTPRKRKDATINTSISAILEAQKQRIEISANKNETEKLKSDRQMKLENEKLEFEKSKFKIETELKKQELELRKQEIQSNEKLKILQIERDERLENRKMELNFELEKEKIQKNSK